MANLPEFSYKVLPAKSLDLADFFKNYEMNRFLEECNYTSQELYKECTKMRSKAKKRKLKLTKYINSYLESPSIINIQLLF